MKNETKKVSTIKLYGNYFIADPADDFYLMIDCHNNKVVRLIDADCYHIIELISEIKENVSLL